MKLPFIVMECFKKIGNVFFLNVELVYYKYICLKTSILMLREIYE